MLQIDSSALQLILINDLNYITDASFEPVNTILARLSKMRSNLVIKLKTELAFYLGTAKLVKKLQKNGLPMCRPDILPIEDRSCIIHGIYNINLALRKLPKVGTTDLSA